MKFKLNRKTIAICSLVLMLFVIGYAYNTFMSTKYDTMGFDFETSDLSDFMNEDEVTEVMNENKESSVTVVESKEADEEDQDEVSSFFSEYRLEREEQSQRI